MRIPRKYESLNALHSTVVSTNEIKVVDMNCV